MARQLLLQGEEIRKTIARMAHEIVEKGGPIEEMALIGIRSRGAYLVQRLAQKIEAIAGKAVPVGVVDVTPFRDDVAKGSPEAEPHRVDLVFSVDGKSVVLVDDVIYTGRTIRAALDLIAHLGKPKKIHVATLVDRGERELPIRADIVGKNVQVAESERVDVLLVESDGIDQVVVRDWARGGSPRI